MWQSTLDEISVSSVNYLMQLEECAKKALSVYAN